MSHPSENPVTFAPNLQILANAGSGKTHTLVTRIIRLLVQGVPPRRIIALTFTRKAAGEFLSKLLQRLAAAALDESKSSELSEAIGLTRSSRDYQHLLREVANDLGKLQLTTLDSFFHRIAASFPQELGLTTAPVLLDTHAEEMAGKESLRHALGKLTQEEKSFLLQALFERDEGSAPSSASRDLNSFRREAHEAFLEHPENEDWGNPARIWGQPQNPWQPLSPAGLQSCRDIVAKETGSPLFTEKVQASWNQLQTLARGKKTNAGCKRMIESLEQWKAGTGTFLFNKAIYEVSAESQQAAAALMENYLYECTEYRLREARAVHHLLALYEREYDSEVRGRGMLTFSDVTNLLQPGEGFLGMGREFTPSDHLRLQLDERLDALFDHWLLDEFQDTSRSQYRALENILDEVISEAARGGERSFFCVGDIKQAIYGWRKGDSRLFDEIHNRYKEGEGLRRAKLSKSWRSSAEVLQVLNAVFGELSTTAPTLPSEVRERWQQAWTAHESAHGKERQPGFFSWITCENHETTEEKVIALLQEMQPRLGEGMTIALLVRSGKEANEWIETLRLAGIEALSESNPPVGRDNPVAAALRSVLSLTLHPGDEFALNHLLMEPLRGIFFPEGNPRGKLGTFIKESGDLLAEGGFTALTEWFLEKLAPLIRDDFSRGRAASLRRAAIKADSSGLTNGDDFLFLLEEYKEAGRSAPSAVQVMTIHKAKGLEYDMVVIPLPGRQEALDALDNTRIDLWHNKEGEPFLMKLPAEEIRNVPGNETLVAAAEHKRMEGVFEELCVWYVAMSRAREALYLFSHEPKKLEPEKCPTFPQLLAAGFGDEQATLGDPFWFEKFHPKAPEPDPDLLPKAIVVPTRSPSLEKLTPSDEGHQIIRGSQAFLGTNATALGSEIHTLFQSLEWLTEEPWTAPRNISQEARELMEQSLSTPAMRELFRKPNSPLTLWREQSFDLVMDKLWLSGCFDRVVIFRDEQGNPTHADLIDFKTDQGGREKLILSHRPQLESYRRALSRILTLPEEKIRLLLIHLRSSEPVIVLE